MLSTVTSHTGQPEKHAVNRHLRPPMRRHLAIVDDDGEGAMGDDDGDGTTGDGATGYDDDDDGDWRRRQRRWRRHDGRRRDRQRRR